jgi:hypothetical protein
MRQKLKQKTSKKFLKSNKICDEREEERGLTASGNQAGYSRERKRERKKRKHPTPRPTPPIHHL